MPAFLIAMLTGPVSRYAVLALALIALVLGVWWKIDGDAREAERTRIERANRAAHKAADEAQRDVLTCPAGQWNRERGTCER